MKGTIENVREHIQGRQSVKQNTRRGLQIAGGAAGLLIAGMVAGVAANRTHAWLHRIPMVHDGDPHAYDTLGNDLPGGLTSSSLFEISADPTAGRFRRGAKSVGVLALTAGSAKLQDGFDPAVLQVTPRGDVRITPLLEFGSLDQTDAVHGGRVGAAVIRGRHAQQATLVGYDPFGQQVQVLDAQVVAPDMTINGLMARHPALPIV